MTDKDPTVEATVADGRTIRAKQILLESIRLGGFTLRDVECDVMPDIPVLGRRMICWAIRSRAIS